MRDSLIAAIRQEALVDGKVMFLTGDLGFMAVEPLMDVLGDRFINMGVAEANMIGVAAGLADAGMRPFVYSMIPFITLRCLDTIRVTLCQTRNPVVLCGVGAGYAYGSQGNSHHAIEDIAAMTALPAIKVGCAADPWDVTQFVKYSSGLDGALYLRLAKNGEPSVMGSERSFEFGKFARIREGDDAVVFATGPIVNECVQVADELLASGFGVSVYNCHTLKPIDRETIVGAASRTKHVFTAEQHVANGGLGSMIAHELMTSSSHLRTFYSFCIPDHYKDEAGSQEYFESQDGLTVEAILSRIRTSLASG